MLYQSKMLKIAGAWGPPSSKVSSTFDPFGLAHPLTARALPAADVAADTEDSAGKAAAAGTALARATTTLAIGAATGAMVIFGSAFGTTATGWAMEAATGAMVIFGASGELPAGARAGAGADAGPTPGLVDAAGPGLSATAAVDVGETSTVGSASLTRSLRPCPVPADSAIPPKRTRTRSCAVLTGPATPRLEVEPRDADVPLALQPAATAKPTKLTTTAPRRADPQRRPAAEAALGTDPLNTSRHLPFGIVAQSGADCMALSRTSSRTSLQQIPYLCERAEQPLRNAAARPRFHAFFSGISRSSRDGRRTRRKVA